MSEKSLLQYNRETPKINANAHIDGSNIDTTRNHKATATPSYGKWGSTTIWSSQAPQIDWAKHSSKDPLANFGSTGQSKADKWNKGLTIFTAALGTVLTGVGVYTQVKSMHESKTLQNGGFNKKETKEINKNTESAEDICKALDTGVELAESIDDDASEDTIRKTNNKLMETINIAQDQKNAAMNKASTAKANIYTLNNEKIDLQKNKALSTTNLKALQNTDTKNMTDEQKSKHKENIAKLEKDIKDLETKINTIDEKIKVQTEIKKQNEDTANNLDKKISGAKKLVEQLNKKIKND